MVYMATEEGITFPITKVHRIEFDTMAAMNEWLAAGLKEQGITHDEELTAK
jgi:hypothetical protein